MQREKQDEGQRKNMHQCKDTWVLTQTPSLKCTVNSVKCLLLPDSVSTSAEWELGPADHQVTCFWEFHSASNEDRDQALDAGSLAFLLEWRPNLCVDPSPCVSCMSPPWSPRRVFHLSGQRAPCSFRRGSLSLAHMVVYKVLHTPPPLYVHFGSSLLAL